MELSSQQKIWVGLLLLGVTAATGMSEEQTALTAKPSSQLEAAISGALGIWSGIKPVEVEIEVAEKLYSGEGESTTIRNHISVVRLSMKDYFLSKWRIDFDPRSTAFAGDREKPKEIKSNETYVYDGTNVYWLLRGQEVQGKMDGRVQQGRIYPLMEGKLTDLLAFNPLTYTFPRILMFAGIDPMTGVPLFPQGEIDYSSGKSIKILNLSSCLKTTVELSEDSNMVKSFELTSFDPMTEKDTSAFQRHISFDGSIPLNSEKVLIPQMIVMTTVSGGRPISEIRIKVIKIGHADDNDTAYALQFPLGTVVNDERYGRVYRAGVSPQKVVTEIKTQLEN